MDAPNIVFAIIRTINHKPSIPLRQSGYKTFSVYIWASTVVEPEYLGKTTKPARRDTRLNYFFKLVF